MFIDIPENAGSSSDSALSVLLQREVLSMDAETGTSVVSFCMPDTFLNLQGVLHGGAYATMLDTACGVAVRAKLDMSIYGGSSTLELKTSFLKAGAPGSYIAKGYVRRIGKSIAFVDADLFNDQEELVGRASATFKLRLRKST
ncbi:PaaI family thioesterase [Alphaproteobacteria bacterium]|nr:PaaI family thioesterase [Alphaproteobacteria bacterium]